MSAQSTRHVHRYTGSHGLPPGLLAHIGMLRVRAWATEGGTPSIASSSEIWTDEHDEHADHFVIFSDRLPIAAARMCHHGVPSDAPDRHALVQYESTIAWPAAFMNRLVVDPAWRHQNFSHVLDSARLAVARGGQAKSVILTAHNHKRIQRLVEMGFTELGPSPYQYAPSTGVTRVFMLELVS